MPLRKIQLATGEIYHVFNRSLYRQTIFTNSTDHLRFITSLYLSTPTSNITSPSKFFTLYPKKRQEILSIISKSPKRVTIYAYCIMPNHFHILLKQLTENGISRFISDLQNSYTRYYNIKYDKRGQLFNLPFKSVLIETTEQFIHVARYIHLNPYTGYLCKTIGKLFTYPWSSLPEYLPNQQSSNFPFRICNTQTLMDLFNNNLTQFLQYIKDQADYQRELQKIKHLTLEN